MRSNAVARGLTTLGLAVAGLVGGHALGYALVVPDEFHRTTLLEATGHGYLPSASRLAVVLGIAAVIAGIVSGYLHRPRSVRPTWFRVALRLALLQGFAFVGLEVVERVIASAPMETLSSGVLVVGLLSQLVVAVVLGLLVVGLRRIGEALRSAQVLLPVAARSRLRLVPDAVPFSRAPLRERVRGPPVLPVV